MTERRKLRRARTMVDAYEPRVPSSSSIAGRLGPAVHVQRATNAGSIPIGQGQGPQGNATDFFAPTGNPTSHELAREKFEASFTGSYVIGKGRYDTQARSLTFHGAGTGSYFSCTATRSSGSSPRATSRSPVRGC